MRTNAKFLFLMGLLCPAFGRGRVHHGQRRRDLTDCVGGVAISLVAIGSAALRPSHLEVA